MSSDGKTGAAPGEMGMDGVESLKKFDYDKLPIKQLGSVHTPSKSGKKVLDKAASFTAARYVKEMGLYPFFREIQSCQNPVVQLEDRQLIMMGSNNYLGLVSHPEVIEHSKKMADLYGTGCAGSRLLNGTTSIHRELEAKLAALVDKEDVLLFSTGYQANLGAIAGLLNRHEKAVLDKKNHACIVDAVTLSRAESYRFKHNDMADLRKVMDSIDMKRHGAMVIVDGVFSMEGDVIDLPEVVKICNEYGAALVVDDAHGLGVLGRNGKGTCDHFGLTDQVDMIVGTFSKSLASIGGFVAADAEVIEYLRHHSRSMIFSASMPPASVGSVIKAIEIMEREPELIAKLWENTNYMKKSLLELGFNLGHSTTPILPVYVGNDLRAFQMCAELSKEGVFVNPVPGLSLSPADALIRISLMATHEREHLDFALDKLEAVGRRLGVIGGQTDAAS